MDSWFFRIAVNAHTYDIPVFPIQTLRLQPLYNSIGSQTDGGITPQAVKTKTDSIESSISTLNTGKANASDVYKKTETYSKTEIDAKVPAALTTEEIASIIGSAS